jgi:hypothetical protein
MSDYLWDKSGEPDPDVERLEHVLSGFRSAPRGSQGRERRFGRGAAIGAIVALAAASAAVFVYLRDRVPDAAWKVDTFAGTPQCGRAPCAELRTGEWLDTGKEGRARLEVADIGHMDVEPGSRLRLLSSSEKGHRLELERGTVRAKVYAPPRLLIVDTPAAAAVDLGCAYTLTVDERGATHITVKSGYVALEGKNIATYGPAGSSAIAWPDAGITVPVDEDASDALRRAALSGVGAAIDSAAVKIILNEAREEDAVTVWHLIERVPEGEARAEVAARLEQLVPLPKGVTREAILRGDAAAVEAWREKVLDW